ncbi:MAG: response regulator transcription factor [Nitrospirota bacterium]|nr:response regulator transcription factor [Nitrospirota bacterium]
MPIRVAIVEDDTDLRLHFETIVHATRDFFLVSSFSNAEDYENSLNDIRDLDVVVMDINLPGKSGVECIAAQKEKRPAIQYLICTIFEDSDNLFNALCAGATGYILKSASAEEIEHAIRSIHAGGSPMTPQIARLVISSFPAKKSNAQLLAQLNKREREILHLLSEGYRYKEIADKLFLGVDTVRTYIRNIYSTLHVHSRTDALNKAFGK